MCDERTERENQAYLKTAASVSRRGFGMMASAAGVVTLASGCATAAPEGTVGADVSVPTPDGTADAYFVHPASGAHAGVLLWPDILGLRPAFRTMADRLATSGYAVLAVNPYYRTEPAPVVPEGATFGDEAVRNKVFGLARTLSPATQVTDAEAFVAWLDAQDAVDTSRQIGTQGYCMTGSFAMRTAAAVPGRIGAAASFHGGGIASDAEDSPHLLADQIDAAFLAAIAENDDENDPEAKNLLRAAFPEGDIEVYPGAMHGWCVLDSQVYNEEQAERAWARLLAMYEEALA